MPSSKNEIILQEQFNGSVPISEIVRVSLTASQSGSPMKERLHDLAGGRLPKAKGDGKKCSKKTVITGSVVVGGMSAFPGMHAR